MSENPYEQLALQLDALPNGYPATESGVELDLLATMFSPDEAALTAQLKVPLETAVQIAGRTGGDLETVTRLLKGLAKRGFIRTGRAEDGRGYGLLPFVVGIYEAHLGQLSENQARLFENYYRQVFGHTLTIKPQLHRVIPVNESVSVDMEIHPYESVTSIVDQAQSWGVINCICRQQKAMIGEACEHPVDVCLILNKRPHAYDGRAGIRALTHDEALATLQRATDAGLVHTVSNDQHGTHYVCNCCTCSCGFLRGMADLGIANVVARSAFVNQVDEELCMGCEDCLDACQFDALAISEDSFIVEVNKQRCVGCGVCVPTCSTEAMGLVRRPADEVKAVPSNIIEWGMERAAVRGLDLTQLM
ncbi:MAG: 4Fe-4S dicluster domain-containing protein [Anaerolineae bacterium]